MFYYMDAFFFLHFFISLIYFGIFAHADPTTRNIFSLLSGIFNGIAMALLFGRFVSMEQFLSSLFEEGKHQDLIQVNQKFYYYFGTIFSVTALCTRSAAFLGILVFPNSGIRICSRIACFLCVC